MDGACAADDDTLSATATDVQEGRTYRLRRPARPTYAPAASAATRDRIRARATMAGMQAPIKVVGPSSALYHSSLSMQNGTQPALELEVEQEPSVSRFHLHQASPAPPASNSSIIQLEYVDDRAQLSDSAPVSLLQSDDGPATVIGQRALTASASLLGLAEDATSSLDLADLSSSAPPSTGPRPPTRRRVEQARDDSSECVVIETTRIANVAESDSDLDDFFTRKAAPGPKRVPGRRPKVAQKQHSGSDSDSDARPKAKDGSTTGGARRKLTMPAWTQRGLHKDQLGAQSQKGEKNRRKRRMSVDSDEEALLDANKALQDCKRKGPARNMRKEVNEVKANGASQRQRDSSSDEILFVEPLSNQDGAESFVRRRSARRRPPPPVDESSAEPVAPLQSPGQSKRPNIFDILRSSSSAQTITLDEDPLDTSDFSDAPLDPAMEMIRRNAAARGTRHEPSDGSVIIDDQSTSAHEPAAPVMPAAREDIYVSVSFVMDPDANVSEAARRGYERPMMFSLDAGQSFEMLFAQISTLRTIPEENLVMRHDGRQIMRFGTPRSLGMFGQVEIKAYEAHVWNKLEERRRQALLAPIERPPAMNELAPSETRADYGGLGVPQHDAERARTESPSANDNGLVDSNRFRITLRGSDKQSLPLAVKRTTQFATLLNRYCKKFGVPADKVSRLRIEFDGERVNLTKMIEDYEDDIEDDSVVDVIETKV
ncbi:hypothetical protein OIV83_005284 [Microbotryomycetes sp. JL201]|nr:hypothetical protein OIV83_005284 [Microbotryomycetes sp. JL201]